MCVEAGKSKFFSKKYSTLFCIVLKNVFIFVKEATVKVVDHDC